MVECRSCPTVGPLAPSSAPAGLRDRGFARPGRQFDLRRAGKVEPGPTHTATRAGPCSGHGAALPRVYHPERRAIPQGRLDLHPAGTRLDSGPWTLDLSE